MTPRICSARSPPARDLKSLDTVFAGIAAGQHYRFRLVANPTLKEGSALKRERESGLKRNGQRVPVRERDLEAWLARKFERGGVQSLAVGWRRHPPVQGVRKGKRLTFAAAQFDGVIRIEDAAATRTMLEAGVGSAKAYGFGLLSIAPAGG